MVISSKKGRINAEDVALSATDSGTTQGIAHATKKNRRKKKKKPPICRAMSTTWREVRMLTCRCV